MRTQTRKDANTAPQKKASAPAPRLPLPPPHLAFQVAIAGSVEGGTKEREGNAAASTVVGGSPGDFSPVQRFPERSDAPFPSRPLRGLSAGVPLEPGVRDHMEESFGRSFSEVRVHQGSDASRLTHSYQARAFTFGRHVVFGDGQYRPGTLEGDFLLAHELAHVAQQAGAANAHGEPGPVQDDPQMEKAATRGAAHALLENPGPHSVAIFQRTGLTPAALRQQEGLHPVAVPSSSLRIQRCNGGSKVDDAGPTDASKSPPVPQSTLPGTAEQEVSLLDLTELQARTRLVEAAVNRISGRYKDDPNVQKQVASAQANIAAARAALTGSKEDSQKLVQSESALDRIDYAIQLLDKQAAAYAGQAGQLAEAQKVRAAYLNALGKIFTADLTAGFNDAEARAQHLPRALIEVDLAKVRYREVAADPEQKKLAEKAGHKLEETTELVGLNPDIPIEKELAEYLAWIEKRLDKIEKDSADLALAQKNKAPDAIKRQEDLSRDAEILQFSIQGVFHFDRLVRGYEYIVKHPGDPLSMWQLGGASQRILGRVEAIRDASLALDLENLKKCVQAIDSDEDVKKFYKALPALVGASRLIAGIEIALISALVSGGVVGLIGGGARLGAAGFTARSVLSMAGTLTLEALTFTAVNASLSAVMLGQKPTTGKLVWDFAFSIGMFGILRGVGAGVTKGLTAIDLAALRGPVTLATSFPLLQGFGILHFRISEGRWPSDDEMGIMTAENVLSIAVIVLGTSALRQAMTEKKAPTLEIFEREYGSQFKEIQGAREKLAEDMRSLIQSGKADDAAEVQKLQDRAKELEKKFQTLLLKAGADTRINIEVLRSELKSLGAAAKVVSSELLTKQLGISEATGLRSAGERSYTYAPGSTKDLESRLRALGARVDKAQDPTRGLRTITATFGPEQQVTFQERAPQAYGDTEILINPADPLIEGLTKDLAITDPAARRSIYFMLQEKLAGQPKQDLAWAVRQVRRELNTILRTKPTGTTPQEIVLEIRTEGIVARRETPALVARAKELEAQGVLRSPGWLSARILPDFIGALGEWITAGMVRSAAPAGSRVFRNVKITGDLYEDEAATIIYVTSEGRPAKGNPVAELDFLTATEDAGKFNAERLTNTKAGEGESGAAATQNRNALESIRASQAGRVAEVAVGKRKLYARVTKIEGTALDTGDVVDLTGKVQESVSGVKQETIGPAGARNYTRTMPVGRGDLAKLAKILREMQLMSSKDY